MNDRCDDRSVRRYYDVGEGMYCNEFVLYRLVSVDDDRQPAACIYELEIDDMILQLWIKADECGPYS